MKSVQSELRRIRIIILIFVLGLVLSGMTAIPIEWQLDQLISRMGLEGRSAGDWAADSWQQWLLQVRQGVAEMNQKYPFLSYAGDWLAFGHFGIALVFLWALIDPVKHRFLFDYGLVLCLLVIPFALVFGQIRGIPLWWRLIDCSFGVMGAIPLYLCRILVARINNPDFSVQQIR